MSAPTPHTHRPEVERVVETVLPTRHGTFRMLGYAASDGWEHVALLLGLRDGAAPATPPLVRLHSECLTGDALGSLRCDCGVQLDDALSRIAEQGSGALLYLRGHEGRGIGLLEKLKAYRLQDAGADTVDANLALGHPTDARDYAAAADILRDLGLTRIRLMSSNPAKHEALRAHGIQVAERTGHFVQEAPENVAYLATKRARMGHDTPGLSAWESLLAGHVPLSCVNPGDAELAQRYGPLVAAGPRVVVAQMAQSLDGFIATASGDGAALSGLEDHQHLHRLRALVDAVVVGAGTVDADDPKLTVREVPGENPVRVIIDPHARIPTGSVVLHDNSADTLWLVGAGTPPLQDVAPHVERVSLPEAGFAPAAILALLAERGLGRVLVEGGGTTVSRFVADGVVDRLFVTSVPVFLGAGVPGVRVPGVGRVADAARPLTRRFTLGCDICTEFVLRP